MDGNEAYQMFKLIIEKIKRKSHKKKQKPELSIREESAKSFELKESENSEADEEAIRVQLWRDAQVGLKIVFLYR